MSGWDWIRDDKETGGEGVARCTLAGCNSPLELKVAPTLVIERCQTGHHVQHVQLVYPEDFAAA